MVDDRTYDDATTTGRLMSRGALLKNSAVLAGALAGAGVVSRPGIALGAPLRKSRLKFAIVPKNLGNPGFNWAKYGGQTRAMELGNIDFTFTGPPTADAAQQAQVVDGLISAGYDGIGIDADAPQPLVEPINRAVKKGIKVITWDSDSPGSNRACFYGVDNFKLGRKEAAILNAALKGRTGKIWILSGNPAALNLQQRVAGVKAGLATGVTAAGISYCNDDLATSVSEVNNVLRAHPDLIGYVMVGPWPLFTNESATPIMRARAKGGLVVVASDYLASELPFLADGTVKGLVGQDYWGWGYQSVQIMYELLQGKHFPSLVPQAMPVVTQANVTDYIAKWKMATDRAGAAKAFKEAPIMPAM